MGNDEITDASRQFGSTCQPQVVVLTQSMWDEIQFRLSYLEFCVKFIQRKQGTMVPNERQRKAWEEQYYAQLEQAQGV